MLTFFMGSNLDLRCEETLKNQYHLVIKKGVYSNKKVSMVGTLEEICGATFLRMPMAELLLRGEIQSDEISILKLFE